VAAGRWNGELAKWPDVLVPGVHQPLGLRLDDRFVRVVAALELKAQALEPVTVLGAAVRVRADLVRLRLGRDGDQVGVHLIRAVLMPGGALHDGAAAQVEVAARHGACAACGRGPLEDEHRRAFRCRLDRGAAAGNAEADHEDVDLIRHELPRSRCEMDTVVRQRLVLPGAGARRGRASRRAGRANRASGTYSGEQRSGARQGGGLRRNLGPEPHASRRRIRGGETGWCANHAMGTLRRDKSAQQERVYVRYELFVPDVHALGGLGQCSSR
jgi:hypothetical protein